MLKELESIVKSVFKALEFNLEYAKISYSKLPDICDYQINSVFYLTKELNKSPEEISNLIIEKLLEYDTVFEKIEFCKPGFINLTVTEELLNKYVSKVLNKEQLINKELYFLDYGGPNIAKPLHVGHLRPAIIGESIKRIIQYAGGEVISDVHLGDYGLQIGQVIYGLKQENILPEDITLEILERVYPMMSKLCKEDNETLIECQKITKDLQLGNDEYIKYWKKICEISTKDIKRLYSYLDISFDLWNGESNAYDYIEPLTKYLISKNAIKDDDGAKIIEVKSENDLKEMPPLIYQKSDGAYLYSTTDLACIYERILKYNPKYILYFTDERQRLHFEQVFRVCDKNGISDECNLEHEFFGTINGPDGKPFKTRTGDLLHLDDLINETRNIFISKKEENTLMSENDINKIVNSIIKFADLQNNRERNYNFDINKFSDTTGKTGPYILYTAIRIRKILNDNSYEFSEIKLNSANRQERNLKFNLVNKNESILKSVSERMPHYIAEYIYNLSTNINSFYQKNNINNESNKDVKNEWLNILNISYKVLEELLYLLGIEIPSKM